MSRLDFEKRQLSEFLLNGKNHPKEKTILLTLMANLIRELNKESKNAN